MLLEIFAFFGILAIVMFFFADWKNYGGIRIMSSFLLLIFSFWVLNDGIEYYIGSNTTANTIEKSESESTTIDTPVGSTTTTTTNKSKTTTEQERNIYETLTWPYEKIIPFRHILFLLLLFMSLYGFFTYRGGLIKKYV